MNQSFFEIRGKEKVRELLREGQGSQAFHRSGAKSMGMLRLLQQFLIKHLARRPATQDSQRRGVDPKPVRTPYGD